MVTHGPGRSQPFIAPLIALGLATLVGCASPPQTTRADSDAPDADLRRSVTFQQAASYEETLKLWRSPSDINDWIGARFEYDRARAIELSETQRIANGRMPIHSPQALFANPSGVCVDLARFGVESLHVVDPDSRPRYLMIEFDPIQIAGNTLRRHWVVVFQRGEQFFFFADSKRPGHIAGPYADTRAFIEDYARYRGRTIVSYREVQSYERRQRIQANRQSRDERP